MFAKGLSEGASEERISARERREEAPDAVLQLWEIQRWQADPRVAQEEKKLSPSLLPPSLPPSLSLESQDGRRAFTAASSFTAPSYSGKRGGKGQSNTTNSNSLI